MRRRKSLPSPTFTLRAAPRRSLTAAASAFADPQAAGLLLGEKNLLQAAWANSAPHHAFGRSLKVGKEEIMGMLAAVEMWVKRDHEAEWKIWDGWLGTIAARLNQIQGVTTSIRQPGRGPLEPFPQPLDSVGRRAPGHYGRGIVPVTAGPRAACDPGRIPRQPAG